MKNYFLIVMTTLLITGCDNAQKVEPNPPEETPAQNNVQTQLTTKNIQGEPSLFEKSQKVIFHNDFSLLKSHMLVSSDISSTHFTAQSEGTDPIITFPEIGFLQGKEYIFRVNITSLANSELQLFFSVLGNTGYPFSEENSVRVPITAGENEIYIPLTNKNLDKFLRLDPTSLVGSFTISNITIKEID